MFVAPPPATSNNVCGVLPSILAKTETKSSTSQSSAPSAAVSSAISKQTTNPVSPVIFIPEIVAIDGFTDAVEQPLPSVS